MPAEPTMAPSLPAAADTPWHVAVWDLNTTVGRMNVVLLGPALANRNVARAVRCSS